MQVDALALTLRPRSYLEASDLGVRLCQHAAGSVYRCYLAILVPTTLACMATAALAPSLASFVTPSALPVLALWWLKPCLDRPVLFALSRAAFGRRVGLADLWREQRAALWSGLLTALTLRRLSPWRAFTQPVMLLEGQRGAARARRLRALLGPRTLVAGTLTFLFSLSELILALALLSLLYWLAPRGYSPELDALFSATAPAWVGPLFAAGYALVLTMNEPFYVAAGFGMYLNRRMELEAWDIEKELRRAFPAP
jgi:hypothetical protein